MMKCPSGVFVKRQVLLRSTRPFASGKKRCTAVLKAFSSASVKHLGQTQMEDSVPCELSIQC